MTRIPYLGLGCWLCVAVSPRLAATTLRESWRYTKQQANLVALFRDYRGHVAVAFSEPGTNSLVLLNSNGTAAASLVIPALANLPNPVQAATADQFGNIYLTGPANPPQAYVATIKCLPDLMGLAWTNTTLLTNAVGPSRLAVPREIVADPSGNAYVIGRFNQYTGDIDQFVLSVNGNGERWREVFNPSQDNDFDKGISLKQASDGTIYTVGNSEHYSPSGSSVLARRFVPDGTLLWASNYLAPVNGNSFAFSETPSTAVLDSQSHLIVVGGRIQGFDRGCLVMKIAPAGQVLWRSVLIHTQEPFAASDVAIDAQDNIYMVGAVGMVKHSPAGQVLSYSPEPGAAVKVLGDGRIVLAGSAHENGQHFTYVTELNADTTIRWRARVEAPNGFEQTFHSMFVDSDGAIYVGINASNSTNSAPRAMVFKFEEPIALTATLVGSQIKLSWPTDRTNAVLTTSATIDSATWQVVSNPPVQDGAIRSVLLPCEDPRRFFRLEVR